MYTKFHLAILYRLFNYRCVGHKHTSREVALKGLPRSSRGEAENALNELIKWNLIIKKPTSYGEQVAINPEHLSDVRQILDPTNAGQRDKPPVEDSLNSKYEKRPFTSTFGDKTIKGVNARYSYHRNITDSSKIICYVVVDGEKRSSIDLGSFNDKESLLVKAIERIDETFKGRPFTKPGLYSLGKDIEGNRQPPKAIIDMLLFFGYAIQISYDHYQRTNLKPPASGLDAFQPSSSPTTSSTQQITDYIKPVEIKEKEGAT